MKIRAFMKAFGKGVNLCYHFTLDLQKRKIGSVRWILLV